MSEKCVNCRVNSGSPAKRGLCDRCYVSPARSLYNAAGERVDEVPPLQRLDAEDHIKNPRGRHSRGRSYRR